MCNNADIVNDQLRGQPTEGALIAAARKVCIKKILWLTINNFELFFYVENILFLIKKNKIIITKEKCLI